jgi:hypothetical protein
MDTTVAGIGSARSTLATRMPKGGVIGFLGSKGHELPGVSSGVDRRLILNLERNPHRAHSDHEVQLPFVGAFRRIRDPVTTTWVVALSTNDLSWGAQCSRFWTSCDVDRDDAALPSPAAASTSSCSTSDLSTSVALTATAGVTGCVLLPMPRILLPLTVPSCRQVFIAGSYPSPRSVRERLPSGEDLSRVQ